MRMRAVAWHRRICAWIEFDLDCATKIFAAMTKLLNRFCECWFRADQIRPLNAMCVVELNYMMGKPILAKRVASNFHTTSELAC